ncbi:LytTr DNA-binding domain-containing protein [Lachnospiraceae bacterium XBB2008]|nr:LytTr DNA-binding domain-containing protein [Lachnospiraceae bacterium XBB2008]
MISTLVFDPNADEMNSIVDSFRNEFAYISDEENRLLASAILAEFNRILETSDIGNLCILSFDKENGRRIVDKVRERFPDISLMICVEEMLSPKEYVRPGILASSILFRPYTDEDLASTIREFISSYCDELMKKDTENVFRLETKDGIARIPYGQINYFEASTKRVYVRLKREDYCFYDTLDNLVEQLPSHFARCHRSYIVNLKRVKRFNSTEYVLELEGGINVPVSRKYREEIRESI